MKSTLDIIRTQRQELPIVPTKESVTGGTYIVTGANTGLGLECAKHFVRLGASRVIMAVRSLEKGRVALANLEKETTISGVADVWELDLSSFESVEAFAKRILTLDRVDALIENASVAIDRLTLSEGIETSLMVNVIGTMLLALRGLPKLQESAQKFGIHPHLVIVASGLGLMLKGDVLEKSKSNIFETLSKGDINMSKQ
jgi:NAD(P)-dependent dehydrogenase (short-subunit alcohol dehydrogenase family)